MFKHPYSNIFYKKFYCKKEKIAFILDIRAGLMTERIRRYTFNKSLRDLYVRIVS